MSISSISNQNIYRSYESLASGKRINRASDDAAGLAIANKLESQSNRSEEHTSELQSPS